MDSDVTGEDDGTWRVSDIDGFRGGNLRGHTGVCGEGEDRIRGTNCSARASNGYTHWPFNVFELGVDLSFIGASKDHVTRFVGRDHQ